MRRLLTHLPVLAACAIFAAFITVARRPDWLPYAVLVLGTVILATSGALCYQALWRGSALTPGAMPALLVIGASFAFFFLGDSLSRTAVAAATSILFLVLVRHLAESSKLPGAAAELRALSEWSALIALIGLSAGLLAAITYLNWNLWLAAAAYALVAVYSSFVLARLGRLTGWTLPLAVSLLLVQGFVVIGMLPTSHWVGAGVLGAVSYLLFSILADLPLVSIKRALISSGAICTVLLATARWR